MKKPDLEGKDWFYLSEAETFYNLSDRKLRRIVDKGDCTFLAMYAGRRLIIRSEFEKYLNEPGRREALTRGKPRTKKRLEA